MASGRHRQRGRGVSHRARLRRELAPRATGGEGGPHVTDRPGTGARLRDGNGGGAMRPDDDAIGIPASDAEAAARLAMGLGILTALRADPRKAIQEDSIRCLICAGAFRQLTNTYLRAHSLSAAEYKADFGYNRGQPLMCRALARIYADRAPSAGLALRT